MLSLLQYLNGRVVKKAYQSSTERKRIFGQSHSESPLPEEQSGCCNEYLTHPSLPGFVKQFFFSQTE